MIPSWIEDYRDHRWRREATRQVETALAAEQFIEQVGFAACLTDSRRPGPSLYVAVCGRRDAVLPRNVQKDPESSLTWMLKDEIIRRGRVYYAKLAGGRATFIAPRLLPCFNAIWGVRKVDEPRRLSRNALAVLKVLRREWEMATSDLRDESGVADRKAFTRALDELQGLPGKVDRPNLCRAVRVSLFTDQRMAAHACLDTNLISLASVQPHLDERCVGQ